MEAKDQAQTACRFFLHYPAGHRAYIVIVDSQRRPFDFSDNRFKDVKKLASFRDACLYATGKYDERADHHYSYGVEFDLARLTSGESGMVPEEGAEVKVHWLVQVGDEPNVTVDKRMSQACELHRVNGRLEPKNQWDREALDEALAFDKRAKSGEKYREFVLQEIDQREALGSRFGVSVGFAEWHGDSSWGVWCAKSLHPTSVWATRGHPKLFAVAATDYPATTAFRPTGPAAGLGRFSCYFPLSSTPKC